MKGKSSAILPLQWLRDAVPLTADQKRKVEVRAREEVRSVSSYVALLIVADLHRD